MALPCKPLTRELQFDYYRPRQKANSTKLDLVLPGLAVLTHSLFRPRPPKQGIALVTHPESLLD